MWSSSGGSRVEVKPSEHQHERISKLGKTFTCIMKAAPKVVRGMAKMMSYFGRFLTWAAKLQIQIAYIW
jgi:hypothetical protein